MVRRKFMTHGVKGFTFLVLPFLLGCDDMRVWLRKMRGKIQKPPKVLPLNERKEIAFTFDGSTVSVEKALNSRCTSDHDGLQGKFHWGLFDPENRLDEKTLRWIHEKVDGLPAMDETRTKILRDKNILAYTLDATLSEKAFEQSMIQSGFQQQATGMICSALGMGYAFKSLGVDGKKIDEKIHGAVKIVLEPMRESYDASHWSTQMPLKEKGWKKGNLPDPKRDSITPFVEIFPKLTFEKKEGRALTSLSDVGQLLFAAKGRTPHLYLSKPWGRTIPAYLGLQELSQLSVLAKERLYDYENWINNRPTHEMRRVKGKVKGFEELIQKNAPFSVFLLLYKNEEKARALWEIGHQLFNIMAQALALNLEYKVFKGDVFNTLGREARGVPTLAIGFKESEKMTW